MIEKRHTEITTMEDDVDDEEIIEKKNKHKKAFKVMPLNCENKVDTKVCMQKLKKKKKVRKRERERALKSICVSDAMLNASCTIIFSMFKMDLFQCVCVWVQYAHPNRS